MFLFCLFWNVLLVNEGSSFFQTEASKSVFTDPKPILADEANTTSSQNHPQVTRKRKLPGNPDPNAEVVALSPKTLMAKHRFFCEICLKGFTRKQNLHFHKDTHGIYNELLQRSTGKTIQKRVYICPELTCVYNNPQRALGDLTAIKKHFSRKHGKKNLNCDKCSKVYALESDLKAHSDMCGTLEYRCHCGTIFYGKNTFDAHRDICVALSQQSARFGANTVSHRAPAWPAYQPTLQTLPPLFSFAPPPHRHNQFLVPNSNLTWDLPTPNPRPVLNPPASNPSHLRIEPRTLPILNFPQPPQSHFSANAMIQRAGSDWFDPMGLVMPSDYKGRFNQGKFTTSNFIGLTGGGRVHSNGYYNVRNGTMSIANLGLQEVPNFNAMAPYRRYLTQGEGGAKTVFGACQY